MTLAYFDCFSGISGDMTLGAMVHLGVPVEWLNKTIKGLPLEGFDIKCQMVMRSGIEAVHATVETSETHHHRNHRDIQKMIENSALSETVKANSLAIFDCLAEAEAKVHSCPKDSVHFHEVGAVDAMVDIVGACLGLEWLGVKNITASALPMGGGFVKCSHGVIPVPAPAVVEILKGAPVYGGNERTELVTPTGAAILAGTAAVFGSMPPMRIRQVGYGAGTRELNNQPNLLRIVLGDTIPQVRNEPSEKLMMVETCIDDMNPEIFSYLMETLLGDGALDVFWVPAQMKKNRPGTLVKVLCSPEQRSAVVTRLLSETTTLGVRFHEVYRTTLIRETIEVQSAFGMIRAKKVQGLDGDTRIVPEYEQCRRIALERQLPLQQVYETIRRTIEPTN